MNRTGPNCFQIGLLSPISRTAEKYISRSRIEDAVVALVTVYSSRATFLKARANDDRVAGNAYIGAKPVARVCVRCDKSRIRRPNSIRTRECICRAQYYSVDDGSGCSNNDCIARYRDRTSEFI